jgi:hypothetical protein
VATAAQITSCAANALHSTGPRSPEGKAASSRNALKLGLYSQAEILPGEDAAGFEQLAREFEEEYRPEGPEETRLLQDLVRGIWLERRYTRIETEVINVRYAALAPEEREFALGVIYIQDAEGANVLHKIERRRAAAQRQVRRAIAELRRLQDERFSPDFDPEPEPIAMAVPARANPVNKPPAPSVRFDKPAERPTAAGPTPLRTPHDSLDNPALRL